MVSRHFEKILEGVVLLLVVFTPVASGSAHPWAYRFIISAAFFLLTLWFVKTWADGQFIYIKTALLLFIPLSVLFFTLQLIPIPASAADALSPGGVALRHAAGLKAGLSTLALYPFAAKDQAELLLSVLLIFFLVVNHMRSKAQITRILYGAFGTAFLLILIALAGRGARGDLQSGTFVNKNHFAGYMELVMPMAAAVLIVNISAIARVRGFKERVLSVLGTPAGTKALVFAVFTALICISVFLTYSRGGMIGVCFSIVVLGVLVARKRKSARKVAALVLAALIVLFAVLMVKTDEGRLLKRVGSLVETSKDASVLTRYHVWQDTASIIKDFPVVGVGLGSFETVYPFYKTLDDEKNVDQPESDYLYFLAEAGVLGFFAVAAFCATFLFRVFSAFKKRSDPFARGVAAGCLAGLAALSLHGVVETSLHMPAILFLAAVFMALAYSAVHANFRPRVNAARPYLIAEKTVRLPVGWRGHLPIALGVCLSLLLALSSVAGAAGDLYYRSALSYKETLSKRLLRRPEDYMRLADKLNTASRLDPGCADYSFEEGRAYEWVAEYYVVMEKLGHGAPGRDSGVFYQKALGCFNESIRLNPYASFPRLMAGRMLERGYGDRAGAEREYLAAKRLNPTNPVIKTYIARFCGEG